MTDNASTEQKDRALRTIKAVRAEAAAAAARAQVIVRDTHTVREAAEIARKAVENTPDDTYRSQGDWGRITTSWGDALERLKSPTGGYVPIDYTALTTVVSTSDAVFAGSYSRPLPPENEAQAEELRSQLAKLMHVTRWDPQLEDEFRRLGLHQTVGGRKSSLDHFRTAKNAVSTPSAERPAPTAVLIEARECIQQALDDLLRRRRAQEQTGNVRAKVKSICKQLSRAQLDDGQIKFFSEEAATLIDRLSSAKQRDLSTVEIASILAGAEAWLKGFFLVLDDQRMKAR